MTLRTPIITVPLLFYAWFLLQWKASHAWISPVTSTVGLGRTRAVRSNSAATLAVLSRTGCLRRLAAAGPLSENEDDEECGDEEECEIDWSQMPGWGEEEKEAVVPTSARTRLEMQWQLSEAAEDCNIEVPVTCGSEPCQDCAGRGVAPCRFCRGSAVLYLRRPPAISSVTYAPWSIVERSSSTTTRSSTTSAVDDDVVHDFCPCTVCKQGVEVCRSCRGTGWIAEWTNLQEPAH
jgi:hypothetical protein